MAGYENLVGQKFGRLTITEVLKERNKHGAALCMADCECGKRKSFILKHLRIGNTASCGCGKRGIKKKHGFGGHPIYYSWWGTKRRCYDERYFDYKNYGGRGIKVCDEWLNDVAKFGEWALQNGWQKGLHLDRINNDGNYSPDNCRFVTPEVNANNKRDNVVVEYNGERKTVSQWAHSVGLPPDTLGVRIKRGWNMKEALTAPVKTPQRLYLYEGQLRSIREISDMCGVKMDSIYDRLSKGKSMGEATNKTLKTKKTQTWI